jgi:hypothetical protein
VTEDEIREELRKIRNSIDLLTNTLSAFVEATHAQRGGRGPAEVHEFPRPKLRSEDGDDGE